MLKLKINPELLSNQTSQSLTGQSLTGQLLTDSVILVSGANRGIGRAASLALAKAGATVILLGRDLAGLEDVYDEIMAKKLTEPVVHGFDLEGANADDYLALQQGIDKLFGRLDGLIHNAAILPALTPIEQLETKHWYQTMQINLNAPFLLTQFCLPLLKKSADGRLLFVSSGLGRQGRAYWGAYGVSKFGIEGLMQTLAEELENSKIRVNSLAPGEVRTDMHRSVYPAVDDASYPKPEDVAPAFVHLMSKHSIDLHGQQLFL